MKISKLLFLVVLASSVVFAQERVLITPDGEAIPVKKGETDYDALKKTGLIGQDLIPNTLQGGGCPSSLEAGFPYNPALYNTNFGYAAGDVSAMIYVVPFSGNISSVHFTTNANTFTNTDATVRISKSTILNSGNTSATYWGYFPNSNDPDAEQTGHVGNTPWSDDATGAYVPGAAGTSNPIGQNLWGGEIGGFPVIWPASAAINAVNMIDLGYEPTVTAGDTIIITVQKSAFAGSGEASNAVFRSNNAPALPFRFIKYYYFGRLATADPGWFSREFDMFISFTITVTGDVPPTVDSSTTVNHTISTGPQPVVLTAYDCNIAAPADTGVASANVYYKVGTGSYTAVPMTQSSSGWSADIPGQALGSTVTYYYDATDIHAFTTTLNAKSYRVVDLNRADYVYSTPAFSFTNIAGDAGATELPGSAFQGTGANDDGTAGPIPIGGNFNFFGLDTMQYVWVSANGGLGLTGTAGDTVWVNSNQTRTGSFANFSIPGTAPRNFIAGFWNDLYLEPDGHGTVWYKQVGTQLIVQYNRVGNFNDPTDTTTTFQIVLDRADSSMTFKYLDVGTTGLELSGLVAAQASSTNLWTFINGFGYPIESQPANNKSIKLKYTGSTVGVNQDPGIPSKYALYANYPNPFNPTTTIKYDLAARAEVELTIYNILGAKVADLVNGVQEAGTFRATWDGRNQKGEAVASGLYIYRLKAGSFLETRKMVLLK